MGQNCKVSGDIHYNWKTSNSKYRQRRCIEKLTFLSKISIFILLYGLPSNTSARSPKSCIYGDTFRIKSITDHEVMIGWSLKPNCDRQNMLEQIEVRSQLTKIRACESCDTPRNYYEKS